MCAHAAGVSVLKYFIWLRRIAERRTVQIQKRRFASRNPIKSLILRTDLQDEYEEINTGVAERELRRIKLEEMAKNSHLAVEALAGLASKEDFTAVSLKSTQNESNPSSIYLLHIKGEFHEECSENKERPLLVTCRDRSAPRSNATGGTGCFFSQQRRLLRSSDVRRGHPMDGPLFQRYRTSKVQRRGSENRLEEGSRLRTSQSGASCR